MQNGGDPGRPLAVLLAAHLGARHLRAQLDSIAGQSRPPDLLLVSDDPPPPGGTRDATARIVRDFAAAHPAIGVELLEGPGQGAAANFLSLIRRAPQGLGAMAFSDQDDVWLPDKLARAAAALAERDDPGPRLYCARVVVCDEGLRHIRPRAIPQRPPAFRNALVQNIATGSTIVLDRRAIDLARAAAARRPEVYMHDWWLYQLVTGSGGRVIYDAEPQVLYRQHGANRLGSNVGAADKARRLRQLMDGTFAGWTTTNLRALDGARDLLTPENAALLDAFAALRIAPPARRVTQLRRLGLYRQDAASQAALRLAAWLGRL